MVVFVTAAVRVAVKMSTNFFDCLFWGGIYGVGSVRGGSDIGWDCNGDGKILVV